MVAVGQDQRDVTSSAMSAASPSSSPSSSPPAGPEPRAASVRVMSHADIAAATALQRAFLHGSLVTELGDRFLARFHAAALEHPSTRAFTAIAGNMVGFVVGTTDVDGFNRFVRPRVLPSLVRSLLSPKGLALAPRFARALTDRPPQPPIPAELLLLVVDERARRQGVGRALLAAVESAFERDLVDVYRVAVRTHLDKAQRFYGALGFVVEQELRVLGEPMTYLTKRLRS